MNLPEDCLDERENDVSDEELENLIERQIKLENEIITTLSVGAILGYVFLIYKRINN